MDRFSLIDSHCHLDLPAFDADREAVFHRARAGGVHGFVIPATTAASWPGLLALCRQWHGCHPALGLHPLFLAGHDTAHLRQLETVLGDNTVVAVGECGLDFHQGRDDEAVQMAFFTAQLAIAKNAGLPVIIHARKALEAVIQTLKRIGGMRGVVHSFSGSEQQARQLRDLGFHLGIGGVVTYPRARRLRRIVASMSAEWLLLETDSPDQPLCGHQGRRNEPARLTDVLTCVAELRGESPAAIARQTTANALSLFGLPDVDAPADQG